MGRSSRTGDVFHEGLEVQKFELINYVRPGPGDCAIAKRFGRGSEGNLKSRRNFCGIEQGRRGDHIDKEGSHHINVVCDKVAEIPSGEEFASTSTEGRDKTAAVAGDDLESKLSVGKEGVGECDG